jgi:MoxR-like ATPase
MEATEATPEVDLADVRRRLRENRAALVGYFSRQRAEECQALDACLLSRHHVLLLGPPGEAKSLLARTWAASIAGGTYREALCTRQTTEQDLFYYLDVPAFTQGRHVYKYDGKLVEGHVQFWDECFKLNGGTLNAGLGVLNERIAPGGYRSPLITAIGASNEMGDDDSVAALEDRWLARFWVATLDDANFEAFLRGRVRGDRAPTLQPIQLHEVEAAQREAATLDVDEDVIVALRDLRRSLAGVGIHVSPRRAGWCVEYLRAIAWLDGSSAVMVDHVDSLRNVLWRRPEDKPTVEAALGNINRGIIGEIRATVERVVNAYHEERARLSDADFSRVAWRHAQACQDAAAEIKAKFGGSVSANVKERTQSYLAELGQTFKDCRAAAQLA